MPLHRWKCDENARSHSPASPCRGRPSHDARCPDAWTCCHEVGFHAGAEPLGERIHRAFCCSGNHATAAVCREQPVYRCFVADVITHNGVVGMDSPFLRLSRLSTQVSVSSAMTGQSGDFWQKYGTPSEPVSPVPPVTRTDFSLLQLPETDRFCVEGAKEGSPSADVHAGWSCLHGGCASSQSVPPVWNGKAKAALDLSLVEHTVGRAHGAGGIFCAFYGAHVAGKA